MDTMSRELPVWKTVADIYVFTRAHVFSGRAGCSDKPDAGGGGGYEESVRNFMAVWMW
jgi:hypothetical protein